MHSTQLVTSLEQPLVSAEAADLVKAAQQGEEEAFAELYRQVAPGIFDYLVVLTRHRDAAEDLLQQTFLDAWKGLASVRDPGKVKPWLYGVARHVGLEHLRSGATAVSMEGVPDRGISDPGPEDVAISEDTTRLVWEAAASLERQHREALNLNLRHGLTYREVGDVLGLRPARANDLLVRSREALGRAVQFLLVARSPSACAELRELVPDRAASLNGEQRQRVDYHLRHCPACRALAFQLTRPEELFGAIVLTTLPATAQHAPALPSVVLGPTTLTATHAGTSRSLPRRTLRVADRHRRLTLGIVVALLVATIAAVTVRPTVLPAHHRSAPTAGSTSSTL